MIEFKNVSFCYEGRAAKGQLKDINLTIPRGQIVLVCGESGCGKTTLTRLINGLIPNFYDGVLQGEVLIKGENVSEKPLYETAALVGSVFQNPRSQFFSVDTTSELAFGCENLGVLEPEIVQELTKVVADFKIEQLMNRSIFALSGGEKQKIACASASMIEPEIFVLDEPSSNLDIKSIGELKKVIALWKEQKKTIIIAEHRLSYLMELAQRVLYMKDGSIVEDLTVAELKEKSLSDIKRMGLRSLSPSTFVNGHKEIFGDERLVLSDFYFSYDKEPMLKINKLEIPQGSIVGIIGNNGAGKTTFARCLCGLERKAEGRLRIDKQSYTGKQRLNECYMVMQNPSHQLFTENVEEEVLLSMEGDEKENQKEADRILTALNLQEMKELHPMSLSGGQQQRVAIASALASGRSIMIFDEPTSGLDYRHMEGVALTLEQLRQAGKTLFIITHDPELIERCCNYFVFFQDGKTRWQGGWNQTNIERLRAFFTIRES